MNTCSARIFWLMGRADAYFLIKLMIAILEVVPKIENATKIATTPHFLDWHQVNGDKISDSSDSTTIASILAGFPSACELVEMKREDACDLRSIAFCKLLLIFSSSSCL